MIGQITAEHRNATETFDKIFSHHTTTVNGIRLHHVIGGKGEPVVLLHGWPQTWYAWRKVMPAIAEHYTVIAPDLRGLGDSEKPATGYDTPTVAEDIYQLVRSLGFQQINLVGHDIGGAVAYAYATAYPETVRRFAFIDMLLPGFGLEQLMDVANGGSFHFGFNMTVDLAEALVAGREQIFLSWFYRNHTYNLTAIDETDLREYVRAYTILGSMRSGFEYYRVLSADAAYNREASKRKLRMPVLALGAANSLKDRPLEEMRLVAQNVRGGMIEQCGHYVAEDRPEKLIHELLTFFGEEKTNAAA